MRRQLILVSFLGALLAAGGVHPQTPPAGAKARDCSQAPDPKACEERRAKLREAHAKAEDACKGRHGPDRQACMTEQMCAQAPDPGKCRERAARQGEKRAEHRKEALKACEGRKDDELRKCMRDERVKLREEARREVMKACEGRKDDELRRCIRDERAKRGAERK